MKCVPPHHRLTASTATLSIEPSLSSLSVAAETERKNYQATWAMKRFDCWSSFEGNPGKISRCLTEPKFYNLLVFFLSFSPSEWPGKDQTFKCQSSYFATVTCHCDHFFSVVLFCCRCNRNGSGFFVCVCITYIV